MRFLYPACHPHGVASGLLPAACVECTDSKLSSDDGSEMCGGAEEYSTSFGSERLWYICVEQVRLRVIFFYEGLIAACYCGY